MCGRLRIFKPNAAWHFPNEKIVLVKISKQGSSYWQFPPQKKFRPPIFYNYITAE